MAHLHQHCHHDEMNHDPSRPGREALRSIGLVLILNLAFALIEFVGGYLTNSMAVLADAVHDLGDSAALMSALILEFFSHTSTSDKYSYGYKRLSLLSALLTGVVILISSGLIIAEAVPRLFHPTQPHISGMLALALLGILVNGYAAWKMHKGHSLNEQTLTWHLMEDLLGWVAVLIGSIVMRFVDLPIIDPILSLGIAAFILAGTTRNFWRSSKLFLQAIPHNIDRAQLIRGIEKIDGISMVNNVRLWSLDGQHHVLTLQVGLPKTFTVTDIGKKMQEIRAFVGKHGSFDVTIEVQPSEDGP